MTIVTLKKGDGNTRRCDARCYRAQGKKCTCICGGRNHGVGRNKAIVQALDWLHNYAIDYPGENFTLGNSLQLKLLDEH